MTIFIDTDGASADAARFSERGTTFAEAQARVEAVVASILIGSTGRAATRGLAGIATESWRLSSFLTSAVTAVLEGDALDLSQLAADAGLGDDVPYSPGRGDLGQTLETEVRAPWSFDAANDDELGVALIARALTDSADPTQIRPDEFELVEFGPDRFMIVLPGVVDLSNPDIGYSDVSGSTRDLDREAVGTYLGLSVSRYSDLVEAAMQCEGVPPGSKVVIVGHSFGSAVALELLGNESFTERYDVTHVVAAAYDSEPQLGSMRGSTRVHVLQNARDVPMQLERAGTALFDGVGGVVDPTPDLDDLWALTPFGVIEHVTDDVDAVIEWFGDEHQGNTTIDRFWGSGDGLGHAQSNYVERVEDVLPAGYAGAVAIALTPMSSSRQPRRRVAGTARSVDISRSHGS